MRRALPAFLTLGAVVLSIAPGANASVVVAGLAGAPAAIGITAQTDVTSVRVTGGTDGVVTILDATGVAVDATATTRCVQLAADAVRCGKPGRGVEAIGVQTGAGADTVDLRALAQPSSAAPAYAERPPAPDAERRQRGFPVTVETGDGGDTILGGDVGAILIPGNGNDVVRGGAGDELVRAESTSDGADDLRGGGGIDTLSYTRRAGSVSGSLASTTTSGLGAEGEGDRAAEFEALVGGRGDDRLAILDALGDRGTLVGGPGSDELTGGPGADLLAGSFGGDVLRAGGGDDRLRIGPPHTSAVAGLPGMPSQLDGGAGDDELIQSRQPVVAPAVADLTPSCGAGTDVLRADPDVDAGVGAHAGPADCELVVTLPLAPAVVVGSAVPGGALTVTGPAAYLGSDPSGRLPGMAWTLCRADACEQRMTDGPTLQLGAGDRGATVTPPADYALREPLSTLERWRLDRAAETGVRIPVAADQLTVAAALVPQAATPVGPSVSTPRPTVRTPAPRPGKTTTPAAEQTPQAQLAARLAPAVVKRLGKRPRRSLLRKTKQIRRLPAPEGALVSVRIGGRLGKRTGTVTRGTATADEAGRATIRLRPSKLGRRVAARRRSTVVTVVVTVVDDGVSGSAQIRVRLRR